MNFIGVSTLVWLPGVSAMNYKTPHYLIFITPNTYKQKTLPLSSPKFIIYSILTKVFKQMSPCLLISNIWFLLALYQRVASTFHFITTTLNSPYGLEETFVPLCHYWPQRYNPEQISHVCHYTVVWIAIHGTCRYSFLWEFCWREKIRPAHDKL